MTTPPGGGLTGFSGSASSRPDPGLTHEGLCTLAGRWRTKPFGNRVGVLTVGRAVLGRPPEPRVAPRPLANRPGSGCRAAACLASCRSERTAARAAARG